MGQKIKVQDKKSEHWLLLSGDGGETEATIVPTSLRLDPVYITVRLHHTLTRDQGCIDGGCINLPYNLYVKGKIL